MIWRPGVLHLTGGRHAPSFLVNDICVFASFTSIFPDHHGSVSHTCPIWLANHTSDSARSADHKAIGVYITKNVVNNPSHKPCVNLAQWLGQAILALTRMCTSYSIVSYHLLLYFLVTVSTIKIGDPCYQQVCSLCLAWLLLGQ